MCVQMEYGTLIFKNSAKFKRDGYFHAEFVEVWYIVFVSILDDKNSRYRLYSQENVATYRQHHPACQWGQHYPAWQ